MLYPSVMVSIVPATPKNPLNNKYVEVSLPDTWHSDEEEIVFLQ